MKHNEVIDAILQRRSIRAYTDEALTDEELDTVLECALWAPSGMNMQNAVYVAVRDPALVKKLGEDDNKFGIKGPPPGAKMPEGMAPPPGGMPQGPRQLGYGAPCIILIFDRKNPMGKGIDPSLGEENICLAAHSIGLGTCILGGMGAFDEPENGAMWMKELGVPEGYEHISSVAIGHPAAPGEPKPRKDGRKIIK